MKQFQDFFKDKKLVVSLAAGALAAIAIGTAVTLKIDTKKFQAEIKYNGKDLPSLIEGLGEVTEYNDEEIKTVDYVDGGMFEDIANGLKPSTGDYGDLGWSEYYNTSTPEAFKNDTLGKCIIGNNIYGAQCVSLARVFWWSYADRDVSTCGTGMAKGMMNCWAENAGNEFLVYWKQDDYKIQAGDWLVFDGGKYGHIGMALGEPLNGYVALLGENQGGRDCYGGGAATNIINISLNNLIGYYRPKAYVKPSPTPKPEPVIPNQCDIRDVKYGDTLGQIMLECEGEIDWGKMDEYAKHWHSSKFKLYDSIYDGWHSENGVGLFADDTIIYLSN